MYVRGAAWSRFRAGWPVAWLLWSAGLLSRGLSSGLASVVSRALDHWPGWPGLGRVLAFCSLACLMAWPGSSPGLVFPGVSAGLAWVVSRPLDLLAWMSVGLLFLGLSPDLAWVVSWPRTARHRAHGLFANVLGLGWV